MCDRGKPEAYFAAMAFIMEHQTTADDHFIYEVTRQIRLMWEGAKMARAREEQAAQRPARLLRLVGD